MENSLIGVYFAMRRSFFLLPKERDVYAYTSAYAFVYGQMQEEKQCSASQALK